jgi:hypothetical protein
MIRAYSLNIYVFTVFREKKVETAQVRLSFLEMTENGLNFVQIIGLAL